MKKILIVTFLVVLSLSLSSMALAQDNRTDSLRPDAPELAARGAFGVGVRTIELVNPDQPDIYNFTPGAETPLADRALTVEVWYPAIIPEGVEQIDFYESTLGRPALDPERPLIPFQWTGAALRNGDPDGAGGPYPLVIVSHGHPGNRYLMSHLTENLASKGYIVAAIDHTDSRYQDPTLESTALSALLNRRFDILFTLDEIAQMGAADGNFLSGLVDTDNTGLIGYSFGGYGVLTASGAGVSAGAVGLFSLVSGGSRAVAAHQAGTEAYINSQDDRVKAVVAFNPFGMNFPLPIGGTASVWDAEGLAGVEAPYFIVAGTNDTTVGYEDGPVTIFDGLVNSDRYLLTLIGAGHSAGAPNPAPVETNGNLVEFSHFGDAVWDSVRQNNIAQHFVTAFLGTHLKGEDFAAYLDVIEVADEGVYSVLPNGALSPNHTYWTGFLPDTASGLTLRHVTP